ncbi:FAD-dependent monooxygenase [Herpetosiphon giganteus]|uniref:FAD-dependent monooxygenase n=1 Tax=Herpetosiphon giganteus TaxID=2029754 RepID=UPI00195F0982|nr:FAD-dependent monooxygenase [Herpetosiphon giganteus]MBM7844432.1 2-polyprenyl-6-methoxyphenol hydroxylase-like FAD-dependent oxidoreductase [Herpetosiphon giganteus]
MQHKRRILIVGGGIAGLTLGYWLKHHGAQPTIIEQAAQRRAEGYGIDLSGSGWDVAQRMGILAELERRQMQVEALIIKNSHGQTIVKQPLAPLREALPHPMLHLMRPELEAVLAAALPPDLPVRYATTIVDLHQHAEYVDVGFNDRSRQQFDLVIGADGIHSQTRQLVFGPESQFARPLGYTFATFKIPTLADYGANATMLIEPQRQATIYPDRQGGFLMMLAYRSPQTSLPTPDQRKAMLQAAYHNAGWIIPQLIDSINHESAFYCDVISQIRMPRWSQGRVSLVADAAHCLTLISGQGAATAMGGAYVLAEELAKTADHQASFQAYEQRMRLFVERKQAGARRVALTFVPRTRLGVQLTRLMMRAAFSPRLARSIGKRIGFDSVLAMA